MIPKSKALSCFLTVNGCLSLSIGLISGFIKALVEVAYDLGMSGDLKFLAFNPGKDPTKWSKVINVIAGAIETILGAIADILITMRESPVWIVLIVIGIILILFGFVVKPSPERA